MIRPISPVVFCWPRVCLLLLVVSAYLYEAAPPAQAQKAFAPSYNLTVHVRLVRFFSGVSSVLVSCDSPFVFKDATGNVLSSESAGAVCKALVNKDGGVSLLPVAGNADTETSQTGNPSDPDGAGARNDAKTLEYSSVTVSSQDDKGIIQLALTAPSPIWRRYRGEVCITVNNGCLRLTNSLPLEDYVCGVLKPEIGASAPPEALKAQAVAARTYAVRNLRKLAAEGADIDDTRRTQGYIGVDGETPAICAAVKDTAGLILAYQGQPIDALYCTDCGGETAPGPDNEPYLQPVADTDCASKPAWTISYTKEQILSALNGSPLTSVGDIESITIDGRDKSGRVAKVEIVGTSEVTKTVSGAELRLALGTDGLRSTMFSLQAHDDGSYTFTGHGWGHGMGMCQDGAIALARGANPLPYDQILRRYYTGVEIVPLTEPIAEAATLSRSGS